MLLDSLHFIGASTHLEIYLCMHSCVGGWVCAGVGQKIAIS